jgi:ABC-type nitrate/sulfonate/bicarbonate transport system ATPase subunit
LRSNIKMVPAIEKLDSSGVGLDVSELAFSYDGREVFSGVNFHIPPGEVWALVGRSGIGKSTLLNVILGLFGAHQGYVATMDGTVTGPGTVRGAVFQEDSLLWWLTVFENVLFPLHNDSGVERKKRAEELLAVAGLGSAGHLHPKELSVGMRKRVELLRALMIDNRYFVADEPFTGLDVQTRMELYAAWRELRVAHPRTGIICTHDPMEAAILCDSVMVMREISTGVVSVAVNPVPPRFGKAEDIYRIMYSDPFLQSLVTQMK